MCYKGKCLHCIPVENGCLAFAIIKAVGSGLTLVGVIGRLLSHSNEPYHTGRMEDAGTVRIIIVVTTLSTLLAFIFSVLLCNGICNRRPGQVKAYFVYGVVITVLLVLASVVAICTQWDRTFGIVLLVVCVIYSPFLLLVHKTYAKLLEGTVIAANGGRVHLEEC